MVSSLKDDHWGMGFIAAIKRRKRRCKPRKRRRVKRKTVRKTAPRRRRRRAARRGKATLNYTPSEAFITLRRNASGDKIFIYYVIKILRGVYRTAPAFKIFSLFDLGLGRVTRR